MCVFQANSRLKQVEKEYSQKLAKSSQVGTEKRGTSHGFIWFGDLMKSVIAPALKCRALWSREAITVSQIKHTKTFLQMLTLEKIQNIQRTRKNDCSCFLFFFLFVLFWAFFFYIPRGSSPPQSVGTEARVPQQAALVEQHSLEGQEPLHNQELCFVGQGGVCPRSWWQDSSPDWAGSMFIIAPSQFSIFAQNNIWKNAVSW